MPLWKVGMFSHVLNTHGSWTGNREWALLFIVFSFVLLNEQFSFICVSTLQCIFQVGCYFGVYSNTALNMWLFKVFHCFVDNMGQINEYISVALCQPGGTKQPWTWLNRPLKLSLWPLWAVGILQNSWSALLMYVAINCLHGMKYCCTTVPWRSSQNCIHLVTLHQQTCALNVGHWYVPHEVAFMLLDLMCFTSDAKHHH